MARRSCVGLTGLAVLALLPAACSPPAALLGDGGDEVRSDLGGRVQEEARAEADRGGNEAWWEESRSQDSGSEHEPGGCAPGEGCFLDQCEENEQCQSGWCVQHLGEGVCTQVCQQECPPGWVCSQVADGSPDVTYICISRYANLCRPCATNDNCTSVGGSEDACIDYGPGGSFCGGPCTGVQDCPWGFGCQEVKTVAGSTLKQCVIESGECPCTSRSVALGLTTPCEAGNEAGTCAGIRVCTEAGLSACSAAVPGAEQCNGLDDDCDGEIDEPALISGSYVNLCDDGNDCTDDQCGGEQGCLNLPLGSGQCNDGDPCTAADHCEGGNCVGSPVTCDDNNACTEDLCAPAGGCLFPPVAGKCDDGDPCTVGDLCEEGQCGGTAVPCDCLNSKDCGALEDGNLCNGTLICDTQWPPFKCIVDPATVVACPAPTGAHALCLKSVCDPASGKCEAEPDHEGLPCDDGNQCTVNDLCLGGSCTAGPALNCNDGNPCTDDLCLPASGCNLAFNAVPCNDGDACTTGDHCAAGQCQGLGTLGCDDGNLCNGAESCHPQLGCQAGKLLNCDDGNLCNGAESCHPLLGCQAGKALACDDGNSCNGTESCHLQLGCQPGAPPDCDDEDPCTDDGCLPGSGCTHQLNQAPCNDGDLCTIGDKCVTGQCLGQGTLLCNDGNPCTADSCAPATGCLNQPVAGPCDDGNACTVGDSCSNGQCKHSGLLKCDDGKVCTNDYCDPLLGCLSVLNSAPCNDGNLCTTGDFCHLGQCQGGGTLPCNDGNLCTDDSCHPQTGCQFVANTLPCEDGNLCTVSDGCLGGWCQAGAAADCNDGNDCTVDLCNPATGCYPTAALDGTPCQEEGVAKVCIGGQCLCKPDCAGKECGEDGCGGSCGSCQDDDLCTLNEQCVAGKCQFTTLTCGDGKLCTDDSCSPSQGCLFTHNNAACDDGNPCTINDVCGGGSCGGQAIPSLAPWQFKTGGAAGRYGPSQSALNSTYSGTTLAGQVTVTGGIQQWTVPATGKYTITAAGAMGGKGGAANATPGNGAMVSGQFELTAGTVLKVIVGQMGANSKQPGWFAAGCSGGGGASFVYVDALNAYPLIAAAGGGGQAENGVAGAGSATTTTSSATSGSGASGAGGTEGNGGKAGPSPNNYSPGGGGGGWLSNGETAPTIRNQGGEGGKAPRNGGNGGYGYHQDYGAEHCSGGFGGGGAGSDNTGAGGGGGGFNGSGGGRNYASPNWGAGGGGGSYNGGSSQSGQSGVNAADGYVTITYACTP